MSNKGIHKLIKGKSFTKPYTTGNATTNERLLIETISVSSYFGSEVSSYYQNHPDKESLDLFIRFPRTEHKGRLLELEGYFVSDGLRTTDRAAKWEDVIELYATILIPVEYDMLIEQKEKQFFSLDLNPSTGHFYTAAHEQDFPYIPVEVQFNQAANIKERDSVELIADPLYLYAMPQLVRDPASGEIIPGTHRQRTVYHTDQSEFFNPNHVSYNPSFFLLAEVMSQSPIDPERDITYLDTRTRGGGIKADVSRKEIEKTHEPSLHNWDIGFFDGQAYQENGVFVVQVDANRFKEMNEEEILKEKRHIEDAVSKYKAFGTLAFLDFKDEATVKIGELIPNGEFEKGLNCGYYSEGRSEGDYSIQYKELGAGDNYILQINDQAKYAIRIPGFNFNNGEKYLFEIKGMKDPHVITTTRSCGKISVTYDDESKEEYRMESISSNYWVAVKLDFKTQRDKKIKEVLIEINDDGQRNGTMYYDYVSLVSLGNYDGTQEVTEI